ncbi:MAG: serine/threonine protein kinase [Chlorobiota bacterium]|nr:MAG: serine/threonine protein kinase [Chlorobiota bacterium]
MDTEMTEQLLFGQYRIESTIGAGGMAIVYKAHHISLDKHFAIKKLSDSLAQSAEAKERFIREARTHSRLEHPNIVKFHDILQDHATGNVYIVMEYVEGRTLAKMIGRETGPIPFENAWPIFRQILEGIGYAHSQGVVHRDIKPGNIIVTTDNKVKILDFGIARDETGHTITQSGQVVGTLQYASPEQIKGERVDQRSDIYNLGMTLYEMVAGRLPHDINPNSSSFHIMQRMLNDDVPDPRTFYPHIPENVVAAIFKAIERDVNVRVGTISGFAGLLNGGVSKGDTETFPRFIPPKTSQNEQDSFNFSSSINDIKPSDLRGSIEVEYQRLLELGKEHVGLLVSRDNSRIRITNNVDGTKSERALLLGGILFLGVLGIATLSVGGLILLIVMGFVIRKYRQKKFEPEVVTISGDEITFTTKEQPSLLKLGFSDIIRFSHLSDQNIIMASSRGKKSVEFCRNSNKMMMHEFTKILNTILEKSKTS